MTLLNPYLNFSDNALEAMNFYKSIFGGKMTVSTFKENGISKDPSEDNKVMHSMLEAENGITFMASDTPGSMTRASGSNISMSLSGDNETELKGYWDRLSDGAQQIEVPLDKSPWGDTFGMLTDKFGVRWMVNISAHKQQI